MGIVTGRKALSMKLERATLNWFAMGQQDDEHLAAMRDLYRRIAGWDAMDLAMRDGVEWEDESPGPVADIRFPDDQGPFGFPLTPKSGPFELIEQGWSEGTFTVEITCDMCGKVTRAMGKRVRVSGSTVFVPATCEHCRVSGEIGVPRTEFDRLFPGAKL